MHISSSSENYSMTKTWMCASLAFVILAFSLTEGFVLPTARPQGYGRRTVDAPIFFTQFVASLSLGISNAEITDEKDLSKDILEQRKILGAAFFERMEELKRFMAENNKSCMVPRRSGSLGIWVNKTRANYQKKSKGEKTSLTSARIAALEELGFIWVATGRGGRSPEKSALWNTRFEEMKQFKKRHGHCNVPSNYENSPLLQSWMYTQKRQYRRRREGEYSMLTQERIDALNSIGLEWDYSRWDQLWHQNFEQLCQYRNEHGNCAVPISYTNRQLALWVTRQRQEYRKLVLGKHSYLSVERRNMLENVGFVWSMIEQGFRSDKEMSF